MSMFRWMVGTLIFSAVYGLAQGSLTPPGAPGPTMKTLDQIEPRVPITNLPFTISQPGSFYLTTNLTATGFTGGQDGITIQASQVTLDLGGFALTGVAAAGDGIAVNGAWSNIWVGNGSVVAWGGNGINAAAANASGFANLRVAGNGEWGVDAGERATLRLVSAQDNGTAESGGIRAGYHSLIQDCHASGNQGWGVAAEAGGTVRDCVAMNNVGVGIEARDASTVSGCTGRDNGGSGIRGGANAVIRGCAATANGGPGIDASDAALVTDCAAVSSEHGIVVGGGATLQACTAKSNLGNGITAGVNATVTSCSSTLNDGYGIGTGVGSTITRCTARENNGTGILSGTASLISDCVTHYNGVGLSVPNNGYLLNNNVHGNSGDGIAATLTHNRIDGNHVTGNGGWGISMADGANVMVRNTARDNTLGNYTNGTGNTVGEILDYSSGGTVTNAAPWANVSF